VLVDRRSDDDNDMFRLTDRGWIGGRPESSGSQHALQDGRGAGLVERQDTRVDLRDRRLVDVEECDIKASVGDHERERKPHVTTTANHRDIDREPRSVHPDRDRYWKGTHAIATE
jgi:hypothetical protein